MNYPYRSTAIGVTPDAIIRPPLTPAGPFRSLDEKGNSCQSSNKRNSLSVMHKPIATILIMGIGIFAGFCCMECAGAAIMDLGPEEIVQAGGADLVVPGYSVPCHTDFNNDGLKDLLVGEGGGGFSAKVRLYLNGGTVAAPQFSSFSYLQSAGADLVVPSVGCMGAFPRVAHFDADGKKDLLVGRSDGTVQLFRNIGTDSNPTFDGGALLEVGPAGSKFPIDVGNRATIALTDWDNNGARDLVLGAYDGKIRLYLNQGTNADPDFLDEKIVQDLAGALQVPSSRSSPAMMDLDGDGKKDLLVGNTDGEILLYINQGSDSLPGFSAPDHVVANGVEIDLPGVPRSRPFISDWTGDGLPDLLVGAGDGRIHLFQSIPDPVITDSFLLGTVFTIRFTCGPGVSGWKVMGSSDLHDFGDDKTADSTISEASPGVYAAGPPRSPTRYSNQSDL